MPCKKILVVDDEKAILSLLKHAFSRAGYGVTTAESGETALKILEDEPIQVMFLDLNMPGMNGVELCQTIKNNMPMSIIFAITGYASMFQLADCRDAGFEDYFKKPVTIKILIEAVEEAFKKIERWKKTGS